ncbi:MAG: paraquat-inducible protein A [Magnetococcales bacterium]|nr:paraquat-inducible protein A [Magnetococcales bacterium]
MQPQRGTDALVGSEEHTSRERVYPHCDALHHLDPLPSGHAALCRRCGTPLYRSQFTGLDLPLALALTGLVLFVIANGYPLLILELGGRVQENSLWTGVTALLGRGVWLLAPLVFCTSLLFPALTLAAVVYLLLPLRLRRPPWRHARAVFRLLTHLNPWSMAGIYLLGLMIAIVKLRDMAHVAPGIALYAFLGLLLVSVATQISLDAQLCQRMLAVGSLQPSQNRGAPPLTLTCSERPAHATALRAGYMLCHLCNRLVRQRTVASCPHCGGPLHPRKPASLSRTWALIVAAALFYIPANLLPIMTVIRFGQGEPDTILSGIRHLLESGLWILALLIFFASILVPLMKLLVLSLLLLSIHYRSRRSLKDRTTLYRVLELFGHWSMVDIFLLSILTALVQLGTLSTIEPGIGATFFGVVVVLTMLATKSFDPRLMWDAAEESHEQTNG